MRKQESSWYCGGTSGRENQYQPKTGKVEQKKKKKEANQLAGKEWEQDKKKRID
jgi:hypothetical protein